MKQKRKTGILLFILGIIIVTISINTHFPPYDFIGSIIGGALVGWNIKSIIKIY